MAEKLLEALVAVGLALAVALKGPLLELIPAVRADKTFWMELVAHGRYDAAENPLSTHVALDPTTVTLIR